MVWYAVYIFPFASSRSILGGKEVDQWYIVFSCEVEETEPLPAINEVVGLDLGVLHFADGTK